MPINIPAHEMQTANHQRSSKIINIARHLTINAVVASLLEIGQLFRQALFEGTLPIYSVHCGPGWWLCVGQVYTYFLFVYNHAGESWRIEIVPN